MADNIPLKVKIRDWTTPVAPAKYPKLVTPDTKFKAEGEYSAKLILSGDTAEKVRQVLEAAQDKAFEFYKNQFDPKKDAAKLRKMQKADLPMADVLDEDGNPTGQYTITVKRKASGVRKDGSQWNFKVPIKDAKGKPIPHKGLEIWSGSELRANVSIDGWLRATDTAVGITLTIQAVQIAKLVKGGANEDFDTIDGGYEAEPTSGGEDFDDDLNESDDDTADF